MTRPEYEEQRLSEDCRCITRVWGCPACCGDDDDCTCAASLPSDHQCDGEFSWCWPCEYRERLRDPSQTSTAVDDLPDASLLESSAHSAQS